jgi:hypothetical protein
MNLTDAPSVDGFSTGVRVWNGSEKIVEATLVIVGNGIRKDVGLKLAPMNNIAFMLSDYVPPGAYGVALLGPVSGVAQYSQDGRFYASAQIAAWQ